MEMFKCLIVDDEHLARETLSLLIQKHCSNLKVVGEAWDKDTIFSAIRTLEIDVLFLDIQLRDVSIFEILKHEDVHHFNVVFTTAYSNYALEGYDLSPIAYILKPITREQLKKVEKKLLINSTLKPSISPDLKTILNHITKPSKLSISDRNGMHLINIADIMYCIGDGNYTTFFLKDGTRHMVSKIIKVFENKLMDFKYFRVNKSCLINFGHIKKINRSDGGAVVMSDDKVIVLSKLKKQQLLDTIGDLTL